MTTVPASRPAGRVHTIVLAAIYAVLLVLVILLKFPFNGPEGARVLNLVPFANTRGSAWGQDIENVVAFVPLGLYLSMLFPGSSFLRRFLPILGTTVVFEVLQYVLAIGRSDITDVIDNTLGGVIGIGIYALLAKLVPRRATLLLNILLTIATIAFLILCLRLFTHDMRIPLI